MPGLPQQNRLETRAESPRYTLTPLKAFLGVGLGYGVVSGTEFRESPHGAQYILSGNLAYEFPKFVLEGGLSWFYTKIAGLDARDRTIDIRTRAGLADLSARYRISDRWQLGPSLGLAFGTDTGFGSARTQQNTNLYAGVRSVYALKSGDYPINLWQQVSTDLSINQRQSLFALIGLQLGLPVFKRKANEKPDLDDRIAISGIQKSPRKLHIELDPQKVFFGTNSSKVKPEVLAILHDVGAYLNKNPDAWNKAEIAGHADRRGRFDYNLKLSRKRAVSVKDGLTLDPSSTKKTSVEAHSYLRPIDPSYNKVAWAKNRRTELIFYGVDRPEPLVERLRPLMKLATPEIQEKGSKK
ncbi:MAG: OmpA family protein [Bdellovibrionota bacterium]